MISGGIIMWSGTIASIPAGYYLCNGSNGTPDLRDRFVVGASIDDGGIAKTTITGASTQSGGELGHCHNMTGHYRTDDTGDHWVPWGDYDTDQADTVPPYFSLAYIMKS